jgi:hypothetical protein
MAAVATSSESISAILILYIRGKTSSEKVPCMTFQPLSPERWPSGKTGETIGLGRIKSAGKQRSRTWRALIIVQPCPLSGKPDIEADIVE